MKVKKMCDAIDYWSPHGLCTNQLVKRNGDHRKSIGCAMGALTLEVLSKPEGKAALKAEAARIKREAHGDDEYYGGASLYVRSPSVFIGGMIQTSTGSLDEYPILQKAIYKYFDMTPKDESNIMDYNDVGYNDYSSSLPGYNDYSSSLPKMLQKKISDLRRRYVEWMSKSEEKA